ncbi:MAG: hypothetical protein OXF11_05400 [Deltaproteobacteria bacterium]|nr:hypothetical protein [Deltaproteobacteria bacterium]
MIAIDDLGLIFDEYKQNLRFAGAPGVGDMFFKHVYNHQYNAMRVSRVSVTPCDNDNQGFEETPYHSEPSALGGAREGVVIRLARAFPAEEFHLNVCKSVREDHVQSDEHWSKHWRPCRIARG